jgi:FMN phosphatase YigB (HAD superfamily)
MNDSIKLDWLSVRAVLLDVDGTLYDQRRLRLKMIRTLGASLLTGQISYAEIRSLRIFRYNREYLAEAGQTGISETQYKPLPRDHLLEPSAMKELVRVWMIERPLAHLYACRFPGVLEFLSALSGVGIKIATVSDYPSVDKIAALGLDIPNAFAATDVNIDVLKPSPKPFLVASAALGIKPDQCLVIGDRLERDGYGARAAGMHFLIKTKRIKQEYEFSDFKILTQSMMKCYGK